MLLKAAVPRMNTSVPLLHTCMYTCMCMLLCLHTLIIRCTPSSMSSMIIQYVIKLSFITRPRPISQLRRVAGVSMAHSTAWSSRAHGRRVLHQCKPVPRRRSLRRRTRRRCVCLRQINGSRGHPLPRLRRAVAHCGARHNALTEAWLRIAARSGIEATHEPLVKQLPQQLIHCVLKSTCCAM